MIYLFFRGDIYYPGPGVDDLRGLFHNKDVALGALRAPIKEHEWNELVEINPETLEWQVIKEQT